MFRSRDAESSIANAFKRFCCYIIVVVLLMCVCAQDDFVVEYAGDLIEGTAAAKTRENKYAKDSSKGCYMYYFKHGDKNYW